MYFLREWHLERRRRKGMGIRKANLYGTDMPVHEHKQKNNWDKKRKLKPFHLKNIKKKERNSETGKGNSPKNVKKTRNGPPARDRRLALHADATAHLHGGLGKCVILTSRVLWRHFSQSLCTRFYYISFRRCGLNFQFCKRKKNLVHNPWTDEAIDPLEQIQSMGQRFYFW